MEDGNKQEQVDGNLSEDKSYMPSSKQEDEAVKKKYGGIMPKKPPLISKDHERAFFDSADWALGKQGAEKPKGPLEALRPKLQPTQQQTRYRKSPCGPADGEDGGSAPSEDATANE
uniref:Endosulphine n=1 Tax=Salix viminalis TaxID=40686 RepID=A0A6N2N063_SALVM